MRVYKTKFILLSILFTFFFTLSTKQIFASTIFQDDFEQQNFNNWNIVVGQGSWSVQNIQNSYRFGGIISTPNTGIEAEAGDFSWSDYKFSVDLLPVGNSTVDRNLLFRATNQRVSLFNLNLPVSYGIHMYANHIWLQKFTQNGAIEPVNTSTNLPKIGRAHV